MCVHRVVCVCRCERWHTGRQRTARRPGLSSQLSQSLQSGGDECFGLLIDGGEERRDGDGAMTMVDSDDSDGGGGGGG